VTDRIQFFLYVTIFFIIEEPAPRNCSRQTDELGHYHPNSAGPKLKPVSLFFSSRFTGACFGGAAASSSEPAVLFSWQRILDNIQLERNYFINAVKIVFLFWAITIKNLTVSF
jgi:hypothetical protein